MGYLRVHNLGKAYRRYARKSGRLAEWLGLGCQHELIWIVRNLNFSVAPGEAVGIVGANGAGKSTLLKMITGTTQATEGCIESGGRISALLELGLGFHPDFTGRQNVFMSGQLLGMGADELVSLMPAIEEFAEIGDYIDQPVRVYSSGMQVRLAFSVATAIRPDLLIVDEALSVGDTYFQHKSFDRIRQFGKAGTTLIFVSHSAGAVKTLCNRAILLDQGGIARDGFPEAVMDYYNAKVAARQADYLIHQEEESRGKTAIRSGTRQATIHTVDLHSDGRSVRALQSGAAATFIIEMETNSDLEELTVGILLRDRLGNDVLGTNTYYHGRSRSRLGKGARPRVRFHIPSLLLGEGSYSVTVALHSHENHLNANYDWWDRAMVFQVVPGQGPPGVGVCRLPVEIDWES